MTEETYFRVFVYFVYFIEKTTSTKTLKQAIVDKKTIGLSYPSRWVFSFFPSIILHFIVLDFPYVVMLMSLCRCVANVNKALQRARLSPCGNIRMTKNFLGDWTCNNLSDENPQGTPGPVTGPQG